MDVRRQRLLLSGATGFNPATIGNLKIWLKADKGVIYSGSNKVSRWNDQSGNGHDFIQNTGANQPNYIGGRSTLGNKPAVQFIRTSSFFLTNSTYSTSSTDHTAFFVLDLSSTTAVQDLFYTQTGPLVLSAISATTGRIGYYDGAWKEATGQTTGVQLLSYTMTTGSGGLVRKNQALIVSQTYTARAAGGTNTIGSAVDGLSQYLDGYLAEVVIFDKSLSSAERLTVDQYLINKYGIVI